MAAAKRSVFAPKTQALTEQGALVEANSCNGLLAPTRTPDAVVVRLNAEVNRALASVPIVEAFRKGGIVSLASSPEQFAGFLVSEAARYAKVIRDANIKTD